MKKKCHSESEMVKAVKEFESGVDADTVARSYNISKATLYNRESKYCGIFECNTQHNKSGGRTIL